MFVDLDEPAGLDPVRVGSKAATLAVARRAGVPVLTGFVVESMASTHHMSIGARALETRGSGGARLEVSGEPLDFADELIEMGSRLGSQTVARSSTLLESSGEWSGAFASYVDLDPAHLPKAVAGCWASAFTVAALDRQRAAGIVPGSWTMAVLIQSSLQPESGGWAEISADGTVDLYGIEGSPAPLLRGWASGRHARFDGVWTGDLVDLVGPGHIGAIRDALALGAEAAGANRCEWAVDGGVWILQLGASPSNRRPQIERSVVTFPEELSDVVRCVVAAPGALGEEVVLPWAMAGLSHVDVPQMSLGSDPVKLVDRLHRELTEEVWGLPWSLARPAAARLMSALRSGDVDEALPALRKLRRPDAVRAGALLGTLRALRTEMADRGMVADEGEAWHLSLEELGAAMDGRRRTAPARVGVGHWEPLVANFVLSSGARSRGIPASSGVGAGLRLDVSRPGRGAAVRRVVLTAPDPVPALASLLWDASGLVTTTGSPAAHLFEAARALRVPAVCGVDIGGECGAIVAIDGDRGEVATMDLDWEV